MTNEEIDILVRRDAKDNTNRIVGAIESMTETQDRFAVALVLLTAAVNELITELQYMRSYSK